MNTFATNKTIIINGYTITKSYPHILIGVNAKGQEKCFRKVDALFSQEQLDNIEKYWEEIEAEFQDGYDTRTYYSRHYRNYI